MDSVKIAPDIFMCGPVRLRRRLIRVKFPRIQLIGLIGRALFVLGNSMELGKKVKTNRIAFILA